MKTSPAFTLIAATLILSSSANEKWTSLFNGESLDGWIQRGGKAKYTVEDGCILGGFGSAILEFMANNDYKNNIVRLGIPDKIIEHGSQDELYTECNFDTEGIIKASKKILKK